MYCTFHWHQSTSSAQESARWHTCGHSTPVYVQKHQHYTSNSYRTAFRWLGSRPASLRSLFPSLNGPYAAWLPSLHTRTGIFHGVETTFSSFIKSVCTGAALHVSLDPPAECGNCSAPSTVRQRSGCSQGTKYEEAHKCWCWRACEGDEVPFMQRHTLTSIDYTRLPVLPQITGQVLPKQMPPITDKYNSRN